MNFAVNKIKFNKQIIRFIGKEGKKKLSINKQTNNNKFAVRHYSQQPLDPDPDNQWKIIAILITGGFYNQFKPN